MERKLTLGGIAAAVVSLLVAGLPPATAATQEPSSPDEDWSASWIWDSPLPESLPEEGDVWMNLRKDVTLDQVPQSVTAKVAAESRYWLYVNGELVVFEGGLKRGPNRDDGYYDVVDLTDHLKPGDNTIAVAVWNWGQGEVSYSSSPAGAGGFLFEADLGDELLVSDSSWKAKRDPGYKHSAEVESAAEQPNYRLPEKNVYFDARDGLGDWQDPDYDDSGWSDAVERGKVPTAPWNDLHERPIPLLKDFGLKDYTNADEQVGRTTTTETTLDMVLDYNAQITPYLEIDAPAGLKIDMRTDNYADPAGNGNTTKNAYVTKEGVQSFEALGWFNGQHVYYRIPAGVTIKALKFRETGYATEFTGAFDSDDDFMNSLWEKSRRTLYITMRDNFMDTPDRERAQWWGDVTVEMMMSMYALDQDSYALYEKGLDTKLGFVTDDDVLYTIAPSHGDGSSLPMQELAGINGLWEYYLYTGNEDVIERSYDQLSSYLTKWSLQPNGLVTHYGGSWDWMDWGSNADVAVIENSWYYLATQRMEQAAQVLGKDQDAAGYRDTLDRVELGFSTLWTPDGYRSPAQAKPDDRANALAVISGLATPDQYPAILDVLTSTYNASPYMEKYVLDALTQMGNMEQAQDRIKFRYADMVEGDQAYSTLWEFWDRNAGTKNHAWTGGPLLTMSKDMAGVEPTAPGYSAYQVKPDLGSLDRVHASVPANIGDITVDVVRDAEAETLDLTVGAPEGGTATVAVPRFAGQDTSVSAGGTVVFAHGEPAGQVPGLTYESNDSQYVYFTAEPGTWDLSTSAAPRGDQGEYPLAVSGAGGSVTIDGTAHDLPYSTTVSAGAEVTLEAAADPDHRFAGWSGSIGSTQSPMTVTVDNPTRISADFVEREVSAYSPLYVDDPSGAGIVVEVDGTAYRTPAVVPVKTGSQAVLRVADAQPGTHDFLAWGGSVFSTERTLTLTVDQETHVQVQGIFHRSQNLAAGAAVTATNGLGGTWAASNLTDGKPGTGFSTDGFSARDLSTTSTPEQLITLDLGDTTSFDTVTLYPRTGALDAEGGSPNFPAEYDVQTSSDGTEFVDARHVVTAQNPDGIPQVVAFDEPVSARYLRIRTVKLGTPASDENVAHPYRVQLMEIEATRSGTAGQHTVTLAADGSGTGSVLVDGAEHALPYSTEVDAGTRLAIEAVPQDGSRFTGWTGTFSEVGRVAYAEVRSDLDLVAGFGDLGAAGPTTELAEGHEVEAEDSVTPSEQWSPALLVDGRTSSDPGTGAKGYSSIAYATSTYPDGDISAAPHRITIDLGADTTVDTVALFGRDDVETGASGSGLVPGFPRDFTIRTRAQDDDAFATVRTVTGENGVTRTDNARSYALDAPVTARYVQVETTGLGLAATDESDGARVQLAEIDVRNSDRATFSAGRDVTASSTDGGVPHWSPQYLTDGKTQSEGRNDAGSGVKGYTSTGHATTDVADSPHHVTVDLGKDRVVDRVDLFARNDTDATTQGSGLSPNFPRDFTIRVKADEASEFTTVRRLTDEADVPVDANARSYELDEPVRARYVQIETTRLGAPGFDEAVGAPYRVQLAELAVSGTLSAQETPWTPGRIDLDADRTEDLEVGGTQTITATVTPSSLDDNSVTWTVEDEQGFPSDVASLAVDGDHAATLTARTGGTAYVVARFANGTGPAARLRVDVAAPRITVTASARCLAGRAYVAVRATNEDEDAAAITLTTDYGTKEFPAVAPGSSAYQSFAVRAVDVAEGTATVRATVGDRTGTVEVPYAAVACG